MINGFREYVLRGTKVGGQFAVNGATFDDGLSSPVNSRANVQGGSAAGTCA